MKNITIPACSRETASKEGVTIPGTSRDEFIGGTDWN